MNKEENIYSRESWQEELEGLYKTAIEIGHTAQEAIEFCKIRMAYLNECEDYGDPAESVELLHKYPKKHLDGYDNLSDKAKKNILWELGFNTKKPIWENILIYMDGSKAKIDLFVCGTERTDAGWTDQKKSPASFEARVRKANDRSLSKELNRISNGGAGYFI